MIKSEIIEKLEQRVVDLNAVFPKEKITLEILIDKILIKYFERQESKLETTKGKVWVLFNRNNRHKMWCEAKRKCHYCQNPIPYHKSTIDHKYPVGRGGALLDPDNLVIACKWCNGDKGILTDEEYFYKQLVNASKGIKPE